MKSNSRLLAMLALVVSVSTSCGCLHRYVNNSKGFAYTGIITSVVPWAVNYSHLGNAEFVGLWPMPVSPALSSEIEDLIDRCERDGVPILGPIRGEFAPIFCMDPPSEKEIYETIKPIPHGVPFVYEVQRMNVRFSVEKLVDQIDECRVFPLIGPAQLHHCHFKCTVWWDEVHTMGWPIPWQYTDHKQEVVYIDKDHLHRCGEPGNVAPLAGTGSYGPPTAPQYGPHTGCHH
jgi:hypothetical protein